MDNRCYLKYPFNISQASIVKAKAKHCCEYSMKIKNKLGNADTDRTKVHQIMSIRSAFDFEEY